MNKVYAGIGTRPPIPTEIETKIYELSVYLAKNGYTLRSGAADGCDSMFEVGCDSVACAEKEIYLPWKYFNKRELSRGIILPSVLKNYSYARKIASKHHPAWDRLTDAGKKLHTRNVYQILGLDLDDPADFVLCYTKDGKASGGTGQAMRIAKSMGIPIFNLFFEETYDKVKQLKNEK